MSSRFEIMLPKGCGPNVFGLLLTVSLTIGMLLLGYVVSPTAEDGSPLLLSPRLVKINLYRSEVRRWTLTLQSANNGLMELLNDKSNDLFTQNDRVDRIQGQASSVLREMDRTSVPQTFEPLHALLQETAGSLLSAAEQTAQWISAPEETNHQAALQAAAEAGALLERVHANPWIEVKDDSAHDPSQDE